MSTAEKAQPAGEPGRSAESEDRAVAEPAEPLPAVVAPSAAGGQSGAEGAQPAPDLLVPSSTPAPRGASSPPADLAAAPALGLMLDVPLEVTVELDRVSLSLAEVLALQPGAVVQLNRIPGEPLDLLVNGCPVARGEILVVNDTFAFRVMEIVGQAAPTLDTAGKE
jgi:flagellar motor switch protein FliN/FliY